MGLFSFVGSVLQIDNWLNSRRDLEAGRELLRTLSHSHQVNPVVMSMVMKYSNSATEEIIAKELMLIRSRVSESARPAPKVSRKRFIHVKEQIDLPPSLQKLYTATKLWYKKLDRLKWKSRELEEGDELRQVNLSIISIRKRIVKAYERLDHFAEFGEVLGDDFEDRPRDEKIEQLTRWLRALKSHPPYISRNKKKTDPKIVEEVKRRQKELDEINKYLEDAD